MERIISTSLVLALVALAAPAHAQDLAAALAARYPTRELVPQSCETHEGEALTLTAGRICLRDRSTGLVRAVRRIALSDEWYDTSAVARDGEVLFAVTDQGGAATRFAGRVWRWDLGRDAYLGVAQTDVARVVETAFGVLYRTQAGWRRVDGDTSATRVEAPEALLGYGVSTFTHEGATYAVVSEERVLVKALALSGRGVQMRDHASLPGTLLYADRGVVVSAVQARGGVIHLHVLRLPATEATIVPYPTGMRRPTGATPERPGVLLLAAPRGERARLDLAQGTVTPVAAGERTTPPELLRASSFHAVTPTESGVFVRASGGGYLLDARGASSPRRDPRAARARCRCTGADLVCRGAESTPIVGACGEVAELDTIRLEGDPPQRATQLTGDGRFRIDRLEADLVRVTRLRDGARLWVRVLEGALFAQLDDGTYFTSNRDLVSRFAVRDGSLTAGTLAPLAPRAAQLFREALIAEFFAVAT